MENNKNNENENILDVLDTENTDALDINESSEADLTEIEITQSKPEAENNFEHSEALEINSFSEETDAIKKSMEIISSELGTERHQHTQIEVPETTEQLSTQEQIAEDSNINLEEELQQLESTESSIDSSFDTTGAMEKDLSNNDSSPPGVLETPDTSFSEEHFQTENMVDPAIGESFESTIDSVSNFQETAEADNFTTSNNEQLSEIDTEKHSTNTAGSAAQEIDDMLKDALTNNTEESELQNNLTEDITEPVGIADFTEKTDSLISDANVKVFQIKVPQIPSQKQKESVISLLEKHQISGYEQYIDQINNLNALQITQIGEYSAVFFMNEFSKLNLIAELSIPTLDNTSTETPKAFEIHNDVYATGGVAVDFPKKYSEILLSTAENIDGLETEKSLGLVNAHSSITRTFFIEQEYKQKLHEELHRFHNKDLKPHPSEEIEQVFHLLLKDLQKEAIRRGGNAVVAIKLCPFPETNFLDEQMDQIRLIATGTVQHLREKNSSI